VVDTIVTIGSSFGRRHDYEVIKQGGIYFFSRLQIYRHLQTVSLVEAKVKHQVVVPLAE